MADTPQFGILATIPLPLTPYLPWWLVPVLGFLGFLARRAWMLGAKKVEVKKEHSYQGPVFHCLFCALPLRTD